MINDFRPDGDGPRYFGVYPAIVTSLTKDREGLGRVEVKFPFLGAAGASVRALATMATPYAEDQQGFQFLPSRETQVIVAFEAGDLRRPYILGATWNGKEKLPGKAEEANEKRLIKTGAGSLLEFDDAKKKITLKTAGGLTLELDESGPAVTLKNNNGSSLRFDPSGNVTLTAAGTLTINAASMTVNAPSTRHTGSIQCLAHTATSVTSPLYSTGAGNIW